MRVNWKSMIPKNPLFWLALVVAAIFINSCRTDDVEVPPLTGPSGARLFLTIQAEPDHLVIRKAGQGRDKSTIIVQLKNQLGQGVPNETVKLRIANRDGTEISIGSLSQSSSVTDAGGFIRVTYTAPNTLEQPVPTIVYILAILTNPAFTFEVTDQHKLDLEFPATPVKCVSGGAGAPTAAFTVTPGSPVVHESACFDATSSTDNGVIVAASWVFGDGSTANGLVVCHTFNKAGTFPVTLTVQDEDRNCSTITQEITVTAPTGACTISASPTTPQIDETVNFVATISGDAIIRSFQWNFGDGQTGSGKTTSHAYSTDGSFTVVLTITDDQGTVSTCTTTITVGNQPPTCAFTVTPAAPSIGQSVILDASTSSDPDGDALSFQWSVPGATIVSGTVTSKVLTVSYPTAGSFQVTLTVTDSHGLSAPPCTQSVVVGNTPPVCDSFTADNTTVDAGGSVNFTVTAHDPDGTVAQVIFSTSGGSPSGGVDTTAPFEFTTTYNTAGTFTATATVQDDQGTTAACTPITITVAALLTPVCSFTISPSPACVGATVNVDASASTDPDGGITAYGWAFPGGTPATGTGVTSSTSYASSGNGKQITLTVTNAQNQTCTLTHGVDVLPTAPTFGSPEFTPSSGPVGTPVTINGTGFASSGEGGSVDFGGVAQTTYTVNASRTVITANVPTGAPNGGGTGAPIHVTNGCGGTATSVGNFTCTGVGCGP